MKYDFSGYVTKNDLVCSDGRIIRRGAFKDCDGDTVPLVWQHGHDNIDNVLGHVMLENRDDGVYGYGFFNDTPHGQSAKTMVQHGDLKAMSIYANRLRQEGTSPKEVLHGFIREVSLVLTGANPGAKIDNVVLAHGNWYEDEEEGYIYNGFNVIAHADDEDEEDKEKPEDKTEDAEDESEETETEASEEEDEKPAKEGEGKSIAEIVEKMSDDKKNVLYYLVGLAADGMEIDAVDNNATKDADETDDVAEHADNEGKSSEKTVQDVLNSFTEDEKTALYYLVGVAKEDYEKNQKSDDSDKDDDKEDDAAKQYDLDEAIAHADGGVNKTIQEVVDGMPEVKRQAMFYAMGLAQNGDQNEIEPSEEHDEMLRVISTFNDDEQKVLYYLVGVALEDANAAKQSGLNTDEGDATMKHNVFDTTEGMDSENVLSHAEVEAIFEDAKRTGSLREATLQHGITNIDYMFPDAQNITGVPEFVGRQMEWVSAVMNGVAHTPFARVRSLFANITEDEARAKGYVKGNEKTDEVFSMLKRETLPQTVYKKQSLDRDDVVDIVDFDVVAWLKTEMRMLLDEEVARGILVGDGRSASSPDKIKETSIRPIWKDEDFYAIKAAVTVTGSETEDEIAKAFIKQAVRARKNYKGSGSPTLFITEDMLTTMLLLENTLGERLYKTEAELATAMRVTNIVSVPVMENQSYTAENKVHTLAGIIVNLKDYNVGADRGGAVSLFDDFDIDYNKQKYLIETRISGALTKPYSAICLETVSDKANG